MSAGWKPPWRKLKKPNPATPQQLPIKHPPLRGFTLPLTQAYTHFTDRLVARSLQGGIPLFLFLTSLVAGTLALIYTPREEEPQIVVPMLDVLVSAPDSAPTRWRARLLSR